MVSLGCPKALVDSERILTRLRADGYAMSPNYAGADVVVVNTCGFLDSAKEESLEAIGEAIAENGRVIVTGCMGEEAATIRAKFPEVLAVTGAHQYEQVVEAVHEAAPPTQGPFVDLIPQPDVKLTPRAAITAAPSASSRSCAESWPAAGSTRCCAKRKSSSPRGPRSCWSSARTHRLTGSTSATKSGCGRATRSALI
jgi:tRNA A37 methylthiotransferase MiaB